MATLFSHALVGATLVSLEPRRFHSGKVYVLAALTAMLPDLDYAGFVSRIPYESLWGHRGLSHSLLFAAVVGCVVALITTRKISDYFSFAFLFFMTTTSHGMLDAFTNGGLGVAFFSPFHQTRYFLPWRPVKVSPMGLDFFSERGLQVLRSELYWIILPCMAIIVVQILLRRGRAG